MSSFAEKRELFWDTLFRAIGSLGPVGRVDFAQKLFWRESKNGSQNGTQNGRRNGAISVSILKHFSGPICEPSVFARNARRLHESTDFKGWASQNPSLLGSIFRSVFGHVSDPENGVKMGPEMGFKKTGKSNLKDFGSHLGRPRSRKRGSQKWSQKWTF